MKRLLFLLSFLLISIITIPGCVAMPDYTEHSLVDSHHWNDQEIVSLNLEYPEFQGTKYSNLNDVILTKIQKFEELYEIGCQTRETDCEKDPLFANLKCYINVSYTVSTKGKMLLVTFYVDEFGGGAANHGYTETIAYDPLTQTHSETKSDFY